MDVIGRTRVLFGKLMRVAAEPEPDVTVTKKTPSIPGGAPYTTSPAESKKLKTPMYTSLPETRSVALRTTLVDLLKAKKLFSALTAVRATIMSLATMRVDKALEETKAEVSERTKDVLAILDKNTPMWREAGKVLARFEEDMLLVQGKGPEEKESKPSDMPAPKYKELMERFLTEKAPELLESYKLAAQAELSAYIEANTRSTLLPRKLFVHLLNEHLEEVEPGLVERLVPSISFPETEGEPRLSSSRSAGLWDRVVGAFQWLSKRLSSIGSFIEETNVEANAALTELEASLGTSDVGQGPVGV